MILYLHISVNEYLENCENCITKAQMTHTLLCPFPSVYIVIELGYNIYLRL